MPRRKAVVTTKTGPIAIGQDPVFLDGYILPREIPIDADLGEGIGVHVDVRIDGRRAVAHSLTVTSDAGVSSTLLRDIEVRNIVATGIVSSMFHAKVEADSAIVLAPLERGVTDHDEVRRLVQELVGYSPELLEEDS